jgi:hypothetical protein
MVRQLGTYRAGLLADFRCGKFIEIGHNIIVVELHGVITQFFEDLHFFIKENGRPYGRPKRVSAFMNVPRPK